MAAPTPLTEIPAIKYVLFADSVNRTRLIDGTVYTILNGQTVEGYWTSGSLNDPASDRVHTLRRLTILYSASEASQLSLRVSGDGGITWKQNRTISTEATGGSSKYHVVGFNVSGFDVRLQIGFPDDSDIIVHGFIPGLVARSDIFI